MSDNLLKVAEVATRLNISESFVYQLVAAGELRYFRLGRGHGGIRFSECSLRRTLRAKRRAAR